MVPTILYEDNHILVAEKPPNMPVQFDSSGDLDLLSYLKNYIKHKYHKPGEAFLGLCHRLDRPVGGVMVFARTSKAAARLSAQFSGREAKKLYAAVVTGAPPAAGIYKHYIDAVENEKKVRVYSTQTGAAKEAVLRYEILSNQTDHALLSVELLTGRKHQIRAQMAAQGYPILYDQRYNPAPKKGQIALWAYALCITHPTKKEKLWFYSRPQGEAFSLYPMQIRGLSGHAWFTVCYEDENILAVYKRAGIEISSEDAGECSLQARLCALYGEVIPVHRLDANTPGLILFARNAPAENALKLALNDERTEKIYHAIVQGLFKEKSGSLRAWGEKDARLAYLRVYDAPRANAKELLSDYRVLREGGGYTLLEIRLLTGRTHQIRAQFAHIGHPLVGDDKYGNRENNNALHLKRQALIAKRITLHFPAEASFLSYLEGKEFLCLLPPPGYSTIFPNTSIEDASTT